jgi:hypothetical protein
MAQSHRKKLLCRKAHDKNSLPVTSSPACAQNGFTDEIKQDAAAEKWMNQGYRRMITALET